MKESDVRDRLAASGIPAGEEDVTAIAEISRGFAAALKALRGVVVDTAGSALTFSPSGAAGAVDR